MKVGNLRVYSSFCGMFKPTLGPYWYLLWVPQCGCMIMLGGVLVAMTLSANASGPMTYTAWSLIAIELVFYWILCLSNPGIPAQILRKVKEGENGNNADFTDISVPE